MSNYSENSDRKFVLTIGGTYGRERQTGANVTLVVSYDCLSQTLQQIHRKGGKLLSMVPSTASFPIALLPKENSASYTPPSSNTPP